MLAFQVFTLEDINKVRPFLSKRSNRFCDYTIAGIYMWKDFFDLQFAICGDSLYIKVTINGVQAFGYPLSDKPDFQPISEYCLANNLPLVFCLVSQEGVKLLDAQFDILFINHNRNWADYLYHKSDLLELRGKKYATPRNHLNKFLIQYPNYRVEKITTENIESVKSFFQDYQINNQKSARSSQAENQQTQDLLNNFFSYDLLSLVIFVVDTIIGFSVGEIVNDTIYIDIEKANTSYQGIYPFMSNQFLKFYALGEAVLYVNREEDDGDEGLRKSKQAYRPISLLDKYIVEIKGYGNE